MNLSARWSCREAGRCPGRHQRARCTANPHVVGKDLSHSEQLCGRSRASTSTSVDTGSRSRTCTCMPFDLGADISIEADAREPPASAETRAEASAAVQSSRPTSSASCYPSTSFLVFPLPEYLLRPPQSSASPYFLHPSSESVYSISTWHTSLSIGSFPFPSLLIFVDRFFSVFLQLSHFCCFQKPPTFFLASVPLLNSASRA